MRNNSRLFAWTPCFPISRSQTLGLPGTGWLSPSYKTRNHFDFFVAKKNVFAKSGLQLFLGLLEFPIFFLSLDLLFATKSCQEPAQNPILKLCHHPSSPKSDFEHPLKENARYLLPWATPTSLPKPSQIEKFGAWGDRLN